MVERIARKVFVELGNGIIPVDLPSILEKLEIELRPVADLRFAGVASIEDGKHVIQYRSSDSLVRQRFTIAHELGHHLLGHVTASNPSLRDDNYLAGSDPEEREANAFAAELLVPSELIKLAIDEAKFKSISQMAAYFGVSGAVIEYRLKDLGYLSFV